MPQSPNPLGEIAWDLKDAIDGVEAEMRDDDGQIDAAEGQVLTALRCVWEHLTTYYGRHVAAAAFERNGLTRYVREQFRAAGLAVSPTMPEPKVILALAAD